MSEMTPKEIVHELNKYIIGQYHAKKAVAIALRNRWRRMQLKKSLRCEITPKNILMIGPTGVGKTEIARRLAKLVNAPFIKVEATKFTEIGYVGKEVDSIIRDLIDSAIKMIRLKLIKKNRIRAEKLAEKKVLDILISSYQKKNFNNKEKNIISNEDFQLKLRNGEFDDQEIEINLSVNPIGIEIMAPPGMEEMTNQLQSIFRNLSGNKNKLKKVKIKEAIKLLIEEEVSKLINIDNVKEVAIKSVEQNGIVFIDEIDKICKNGDISGPDVSRQGVQRDLLPLVEGCTVSTKHGLVKTDHILFIASGSFQLSSPSDLIPELQGRLPVRVELKSLTIGDFEKILIEPSASLIKQYIALMATENINIFFTKNSIKKIAKTAWKINERTENIGARRLYSILEKLMEDIFYDIKELKGKSIFIDTKYVGNQLDKLVSKEDFSRFIL